MGKTFKKDPVRRIVDGKLRLTIQEYPDKDSKNRKSSRGCLNHSTCGHCESNRTYRNKRREEKWGLND